MIGCRRRGCTGGAHLPSSPPDSSTCVLLSVCLAWRRVWQPSEPAYEGHLHRRLPLFGEFVMGSIVMADSRIQEGEESTGGW